jgi:large subunit ribosomal protein L28
MPILPNWQNTLDVAGDRSDYSCLFQIPMARKCDITGARPKRGRNIHRRGLAKKKGGIGMHVTKATPRWHLPNLKTKRVWVPELKKFVTVKATANAFKTLSKKGAYDTLSKAGIVR